MSVLHEAFGVESLPANWRELPLAAVARERKGNKNAGMIEDNLLSLSFGNIVRKDIEGTGGLLPDSFDGYQIVEPGDLVMRLTDLQNDKRSLRSGLCSERGIITSAYLALEPIGLDPQFFAFLMRAYDVAKVLYPLGGGLRQSIGFEDIRRLPIVLPPIEEQRRIADFLDDQVGRIDQAIDEKKNQFENFDSRWVEACRDLTTRGTSANPETRSTGIQWMPSINSNWQLRRLSEVFQTGSGGTPPSTNESFYDGPYPWVNTGDLNDDRVTSTKRTVTHEALSEISTLKIYQPGSLVVAMYGATIGKVGLLDLAACVNQACCMLTNGSQEITKFAFYWFLGHRREIIELGAGEGQPNIGQEVIRALRIPIPIADEVEVIVSRLDQDRESSRERRQLFTAGIALLEERKRSLITAAVTGQLDVIAARPIMELAA